MRKIILLLMAGMFMVACDFHNNSTVNQNIKNVDDAMHFEYNGHKYILFHHSQGFSYDHYTGFVHDPDCPCQNKD